MFEDLTDKVVEKDLEEPSFITDTGVERIRDVEAEINYWKERALITKEEKDKLDLWKQRARKAAKKCGYTRWSEFDSDNE